MQSRLIFVLPGEDAGTVLSSSSRKEGDAYVSDKKSDFDTQERFKNDPGGFLSGT